MSWADWTLPLALSGSVATAVTLSAWKILTKYWVPVPPNRALILYGRHEKGKARAAGAKEGGLEIRAPRILVGGGAYVFPWRKGAGYLSLEPIDSEVLVRVSTAGRDPTRWGWEARISIQVKIPAESSMLQAAAENLLGKNEEEIRKLVVRAVEGAVPPLLVNLSGEEGSVDWEHLASEFQASTARDLVPNGLIIRSFSIKGLRSMYGPPDPGMGGVTVTPVPPDLLLSPGTSSSAYRALEARLDRAERELGSLEGDMLVMTRSAARFPPPTPAGPYGSIGSSSLVSAAVVPPDALLGGRNSAPGALLNAKQ